MNGPGAEAGAGWLLPGTATGTGVMRRGACGLDGGTVADGAVCGAASDDAMPSAGASRAARESAAAVACTPKHFCAIWGARQSLHVAH